MQALAQGGGPTVRGSQNRLRLHRKDTSGKLVETSPSLTDPVQEPEAHAIFPAPPVTWSI